MSSEGEDKRKRLTARRSPPDARPLSSPAPGWRRPDADPLGPGADSLGHLAPARRPAAPAVGGSRHCRTRRPALAGGFGPPAVTPGIGGGGAGGRGGSGRWVRCGTTANVCGAERSSRAGEGMETPHGCGTVRGRRCGRRIASSDEGKERVGGSEWL